MPGKLFVISASSGAGKTSLANVVIERIGTQCSIERVVTYTTKKASSQEEHGKDYFFITPHEFQEKIQQSFFIEWSTSYDNHYGSPKDILTGIAQGTSYVVILDRLGTQAVAKRVPDAVLIWIHTSDINILRDRLEKRARDSAEQIERRLQIAVQELEQEMSNRLYKYHVLNDDFDAAANELGHIVQTELGLAKSEV